MAAATSSSGPAASIATTGPASGWRRCQSASANVSNADATLYRLNPSSGRELSSVVVTLDGVPVAGMNGLATDPGTGELWGIFRVGGGAGARYLGTVDPVTGVASAAGILPYNFAGIAFLPEPSPTAALAAGAIALAIACVTRERSTFDRPSSSSLRRFDDSSCKPR